MTAIDVRGLTKRFGAKTVVDNVSLSVREGEIAGFLGPNGSGKTTTIRMVCGLLTPDAGEGTVLGFDLGTNARRIKELTGYMTQRFSFYEDLSIHENLEFVARLYRLKRPRSAVDEAIEKLGLGARRNQLAGTLSGGWKQRLALAACVMHTPRLLLLDEPTAGVDPLARREFWDQIHELAAGGMTILVSTHYMDEAERCHRINYLSRGRLLTSGTVAEVIASAGLHTVHLRGARIAEAKARLAAMDGVEQAAPFGNVLHVVGPDPGPLLAAAQKVASSLGLDVSEGETTLEDVFIHLMHVSEKAAA